MAKPIDSDSTLCPVSRSTEIVGDRWSILIIRELSFSVSRFQALQTQTGATAQMLAARLKKLEADGLVERRPYPGRPLRNEYLLTRKGQEFLPVLFALRDWGETWCKAPDEGPAVRATHRICGTELGPDGVCPQCKQRAHWREVAMRMTPEYREERERRSAAGLGASNIKRSRKGAER